MDNWFYVNGSERVGPISQNMLLELFRNNDISLETYVWKKGFENWERFKNVEELNLLNHESGDDDFYLDEIESEESHSNHTSYTDNNDATSDIDLDLFNESVAVDEEFSSKDEFIIGDDFDLDFSWKDLSEEDELFYIKVGRDRGEHKTKVYGPYSLIELKAAYEEKRITNETLLFGAGMSSWVKVHNTPINELFSEKFNHLTELDERPILLLLKQNEEEFLGIIKEANLPKLILGIGRDVKNLNDHSFICSIYSGNELKFTKVQVELLSYNEFTQVAECKVEGLSKEIRELILKFDI